MFHIFLDKALSDRKITNPFLSNILIENYGYKISKESLAKYRNGTRTPEPQLISHIANYLNIPEQDLFNPEAKEQIVKDELKNNPHKYALKEKELDQVNATYYEDIYACMGSNEIINDESNSSIMTFDRKFLEKELGKHNFKNLTVIKTIGDSMEPTIKEGELLIISPFLNDHNNILSGSVYIIAIDGKPYVKRLSEHPLTHNIEIYSDNERHPSFNITAENKDKLEVIGRVLGHFSFL
ncbi:hypothetical protein CRV02_01020 [Arcobacter sp. CECT 8989]|uniref:S24 family peptidase n=1 Tax=Arcobacter sp. CECT 8989 TaxID=2044509 RepID=UPI00100BA832|nr:S24 family peptidase [Arcobacter sp. CECT 8989]RXK03807.1 hypothetical protein CRV02_01020 [Arcobacter sp. CECT 8989]